MSDRDRLRAARAHNCVHLTHIGDITAMPDGKDPVRLNSGEPVYLHSRRYKPSTEMRAEKAPSTRDCAARDNASASTSFCQIGHCRLRFACVYIL